MRDPKDVQALAQQLIAGTTPEERAALLNGLLSGSVTSIFEKLESRAEPTLSPSPSEPVGFRVRLDLLGTKPPVWRRLELPGDLTLPRVHDAIQAAMGWTNSHLHQFRTGRDRRSPHFVTEFDVEEGEDGLLEDDVRLDQLVGSPGDTLWYEYDFGDGWDHAMTVEAVLEEPPVAARCLAGRLECPPEDCGGIGGYAALATWVRGGYDEALLPSGFDDAAHAHDWLPLDWHPDHFDLDEINEALDAALAEPVAVTGELAVLADALEHRGIRRLRTVLGRPASHGPTDVTEEEADRLTSSYRVLLDVIGDGVDLTSAGYLPPRIVEQIAQRTGITSWWFGKANREESTRPVVALRETARTLGLVTVRKGQLLPTAAGLRCRVDPDRLWTHIVGRLPLGTKDFDRQAGWIALAVVGSGVPAERWSDEIGELLQLVGWGFEHDWSPSLLAPSPTLRVLDQLGGAAWSAGRLTGSDPALAATARAAIRPR